MGEAGSGRPKQLYIDEHWDRFIDLTVRRGVYGVLAGGAAAVLLARGPSARAAAVAFGAGVGVGSAYTESQTALRK